MTGFNKIDKKWSLFYGSRDLFKLISLNPICYRANIIMLSLDPPDKFGNKHPQAFSLAVFDLWLSVFWFNGDQRFCPCGAEIKKKYEQLCWYYHMFISK